MLLRKLGYYGNSYHETCHLWQWCAFYWQRHRRRASQTWSRTLCLKRTADFHTPHMCTPLLLCCLHIYRKTPCQHIQRTNIKGWYSLQCFAVYSYIIRKHWAPCWLDSIHGIWIHKLISLKQVHQVIMSRHEPISKVKKVYRETHHILPFFNKSMLKMSTAFYSAVTFCIYKKIMVIRAPAFCKLASIIFY